MPTHQIFPGYNPIAVGSTASSAAMTATLTTQTGKMTYCTGFDVGGGGATANTQVQITLAGLQAGTLTFAMNVLSTVGVAVNAAGGLSVRFPDPLPASAIGTAIVISVPSYGAGNTLSSVNLYGLIPQ